jgi:hypothetical protein
MPDVTLVRLGGVFGLLAVVAVIPAYLVGYPDAPGSPAEAETYFGVRMDAFVLANGVLPLLHVFFFLLFLGVLYGVLRSAEEGARGGGLPAAAWQGASCSRRSRQRGSQQRFSTRRPCSASVF